MRLAASQGLTVSLYSSRPVSGDMRADLGLETDVPDHRPKCVRVDGRAFALFRVDGDLYCLENRCTHMGGPLCQGSLQAAVVVCPWHGSRFDVRTGQVVGGPAPTPVHAVPVTVDGGRIWAELP